MTKKEIEFIRKEIENNRRWANRELSEFESSSDPAVRLDHFHEYQACNITANAYEYLLTNLSIYFPEG